MLGIKTLKKVTKATVVEPLGRAREDAVKGRDLFAAFWKGSAGLVRSMRAAAASDPEATFMSFEDACHAWKVGGTVDATDRAARINTLMATVFLAVCAWCVAYLARSLAEGHIVAAASCTIAGFTSFVSGAASLWRRQVFLHRKYVPFFTWVRRGGTLLIVALVAAAAWTTLTAGRMEVMAQNASQTPSINLPSGVSIEKGTDISANMLSYMLGSSVFEAIGGTAVSGGPTWVNPVGGLILQILQVLNLASLSFVSVWILYMWGIFTVATAHQGKELGGGMYNSLWVPTRHALSFSLTVPVLQGLSLLQVATLATVCWSINFANVIWDTSAAYISQNVLNPKSITTISTNSLAAEARRMLPMLFQSAVIQSLDATATTDGSTSAYWNSKATICNDSTNQPSDSNNNVTTTCPDYYSILQTTPTGMTLALRAPSWAEPSAMGSVEFSYVNTTSQSAATIKQLATDRIKAVTDLMQGARALALQYLSTSPIGGTGTPYSSTGGGGSLQSEETLVKAYVDSVQTALTTASSSFSNSSFQNEVNVALDIQSGGGGGTTIGWMGAGLFAFAASEIQAQLDDALLGEADIRPVDQKSLINSDMRNATVSSSNDPIYATDIFKKGGWSQAQAQALHESGVWYATQVDHHLTYSVTAQTDSDSSLLPLMKQVAERLVMIPILSSEKIQANGNGGILSSVLESFAASDPFVVIKAFGDRLVAASYFILTASGGLSILTGLFSRLMGAASMLSSISTTLAIALLACGITLAYIAPITPFLFWLRALLGWVFLLLETLVAAPFWAIIHAAPQGQGFAGDAGRKGYFMLVDVLLRAPLLVLGAVVSFGIMRVVGWLFYSLFSKWFAAAGAVMPFGLTGDIVYSVVVIAFMYSLSILVYTKGITYFPEKIVKWISDSMAGSLDAEELHSQPSRIVGIVVNQSTMIGARMGGGALGAAKAIGSGLKGGGDEGGGSPSTGGPPHIVEATGKDAGSSHEFGSFGRHSRSGASSPSGGGAAATKAQGATQAGNIAEHAAVAHLES
jgi:conjugal transfer/type IV secretion protein DotA/TraY